MKRLHLGWIFAVLAVFFGLLWSLLPAQAAPAAVIRYVSPVSGVDEGDCAGDAAPCRTLQYAANQAQAGDELYIAALDNGAIAIYTSTGAAPVLTVNKSLILGGGYVYLHGLGMAVWQRGTVPAVSVINGESQRQGVRVSGATTVTLAGLALVNGQAAQGGNLYAENTTVRFAAVGVLSGTATAGGGLYLKNCQTEFDPVNFDLGALADLSGALLVRGNSAQRGGGIYVEGGSPALAALAVVSNSATLDGGGLYLAQGEPVIAGAIVMENHAGQRGGGLFLDDSFARVAATSVYSNAAAEGGGFYLDGPLASWPVNVPIIANNYVRHNRGGGFYFNQVIAGVVNNIVANNDAGNSSDGLGAYLYAASPYFIHNTFAENTGGALYLTHKPGQAWPPLPPIPSLPQFTNNIIVSHTVGVHVESTGLPYPLENRATLEGTLWWGNAANAAGAGQVADTESVSGDPRFTCVADSATCLLPYHLAGDSPAVDAGVSLDLALPDDDAFLADIDGQLRPSGDGYDIGADEVVNRTFDVWLLPALSTAVVAPGETVTYTHRLLNTGAETDTYDLSVEPGAGWAVLVGAPVITLRSQTSATVQVRVTAPLDAANGVSDTTTLSAVSRADEDRSAQALDVTWVITGELPFYDIGVDKWADAAVADSGAAVHYTLLVTHSEDITTALVVTLTDTFAPVQALAAWQLPQPCHGVTTTGVITCVWTLNPSTLQTALPLVVTTNATYSGTLINLATVHAPIVEVNLSNNTAQETVLIRRYSLLYLPLVLRN
ncbi:MAG: right-handed parallel beta-helix repeat-containing protein [Anaerolineae bacterium]|nr:right-handed parallel beta-helix repeat-containing protein [Anaerolineae bacterium]